MTHPSTEASRRWLVARVIVVVMAFVVVVPALVGYRTEPTVAAWSDAEHQGGRFRAGTVPTVSLHACQMNFVLVVFTSTTVTFTPPDGYGPGDVIWRVGTSPDQMRTANPPISGPQNGRYTATFSSGLLTGLISGILGNDFYLSAHVPVEGWQPVPRYAQAESTLLGLGAQCTVNVTP